MMMHGNRSTVPKGTEILEFPFKRILLRKKSNRGVILSLCRERSPREGIFSSEGRFGDEGIRFAIFCTKPMDAEAKGRQLKFRGSRESTPNPEALYSSLGMFEG